MHAAVGQDSWSIRNFTNKHKSGLHKEREHSRKWEISRMSATFWGNFPTFTNSNSSSVVRR